MSQINTVLFDWGGVVADDPGDEFLSKLLYNLGATGTQVKEIFEIYMKRFMRGQISETQYWQELKNRYGFAIHDTISDEFKKWKGLNANPDILNLIQECKQAGLHVGLLSNVIEPTYNVLDSAGYYARFDSITASCKVGYAKPEPEIYQIALQNAGALASEALFIDDKKYCLDGAAALGIQTILAVEPAQIIADVRARLPQLT